MKMAVNDKLGVNSRKLAEKFNTSQRTIDRVPEADKNCPHKGTYFRTDSSKQIKALTASEKFGSVRCQSSPLPLIILAYTLTVSQSIAFVEHASIISCILCFFWYPKKFINLAFSYFSGVPASGTCAMEALFRFRHTNDVTSQRLSENFYSGRLPEKFLPHGRNSFTSVVTNPPSSTPLNRNLSLSGVRTVGNGLEILLFENCLSCSRVPKRSFQFQTSPTNEDIAHFQL